jgi:hypothetical protein
MDSPLGSLGLNKTETERAAIADLLPAVSEDGGPPLSAGQLLRDYFSHLKH